MHAFFERYLSTSHLNLVTVVVGQDMFFFSSLSILSLAGGIISKNESAEINLSPFYELKLTTIHDEQKERALKADHFHPHLTVYTQSNKAF